jgi:hypothetical protein
MRTRIIIIVLAVVLWTGIAFGQRVDVDTVAIGVGVGIGGDSRSFATGGNSDVTIGDTINTNALEQTISPSQVITIKASQRPLLGTPVTVPNILPQLEFGESKIVKSIIVDSRLKEWNGEIILDIVIQKNTTVNKVIKKMINLVKDASIKEDLRKCRIITLSSPSTKMWSTGGSMSFGGSAATGTGGMSGALGFLPTWGRMTSNNKIELIIVRVVP